jgi:hypothetical protein
MGVGREPALDRGYVLCGWVCMVGGVVENRWEKCKPRLIVLREARMLEILRLRGLSRRRALSTFGFLVSKFVNAALFGWCRAGILV